MVINTERHRPAFIDRCQKQSNPDHINKPQAYHSTNNPNQLLPKIALICCHKGNPETIHSIPDAIHGDYHPPAMHKPDQKTRFDLSRNMKKRQNKSGSMDQRHLDPAHIIQVICNKRTVISAGRSNANNSKRSKVTQAKDPCKFQQVNEKRIFQSIVSHSLSLQAYFVIARQQCPSVCVIVGRSNLLVFRHCEARSNLIIRSPSTISLKTCFKRLPRKPLQNFLHNKNILNRGFLAMTNQR